MGVQTHGYSYTRTYAAWRAMLKRCYNPNDASFGRYGAVGVRVCARWQDAFENFLADLGEVPPKMSLDRRDGGGDYTPTNCRWATRVEQQRNCKSNRLIVVDGQTKTLAEWSEIAGLHAETIARRLNRGWLAAEAVARPSIPPRERRSRC